MPTPKLTSLIVIYLNYRDLTGHLILDLGVTERLALPSWVLFVVFLPHPHVTSGSSVNKSSSSFLYLMKPLVSSLTQNPVSLFSNQLSSKQINLFLSWYILIYTCIKKKARLYYFNVKTYSHQLF